MKDKEMIKELEKWGYSVEKQPRFKITCKSDDDYQVEYDEIRDFYKEVLSVLQEEAK